jgi:tRNA threonylcarbamoyladenosine dehydratase
MVQREARPPSNDLLQLQNFDEVKHQNLAPAPTPTNPQEEQKSQDAADTQYRLHRRFDRLGRLFGDTAVERLMSQRVVVFGLGGVGSFAAESLARSAIGHMMLVDFDQVCVTNTNRQLQAMRGTIGQHKATILQERLSLVNPHADIRAEKNFYNAETSDALLQAPWSGPTGNYDFVVDCIDNLTAKAHLIATCVAKKIPLVSSMGAAGKLDPTRIQIADLADTHGCPMAKDMRRILRKNYGFPQKGPMGVTAVFSSEARSWPRQLSYDKGEGFKCVCPHKSSLHGCDSRNLIDGTAVYVTGAFGLVCSSAVINTLTKSLMEQAPKDTTTGR